MGVFSIFCALCGGPLTRVTRTRSGADDPDEQARDLEETWNDHYYDGNVISVKDMEWLTRVQVLECEDASVYLSAVGRYSHNNIVLVPSEEGDKPEVAIECYPFTGASAREKWPGLPVHEACMSIFRRTLALKAEAHGMRTVPFIFAFKAMWSHAMYYKAALAVEYGPNVTKREAQFWEQRLGEEWLCTDPDIVGALSALLNNPPRNAAVSTCSSAPENPLPELPPLADVGARSRSDIFGSLPHEVLEHITLFLSRTSYTSLRLASRAFAVLPLDTQAFWLSRILNDLPFIWESVAADTGERDWRAVYRALTHPGQHDVAHGLKNRRRIWQVCSMFADEAMSKYERAQEGPSALFAPIRPDGCLQSC